MLLILDFLMPDLSFTYSGGSNNDDPSLSLGGDPSSHIIPESLNALFSDVSSAEASSGNVDYRCFYIFNDSGYDLVDLSVWMEEDELGSTCSLGIPIADEIQTMTFSGATGGDFTLTLDDQTTGTINYSATPATLADNIQTALQALDNASSVVVSSESATVYTVTWSGDDGSRKYPLLELEDNNLTPGGSTISFAESVAGSPVNSIAVEIGVSTNPPSGVTFSQPDSGDPVVLALVHDGEGLPVWIRRTTEAGTEATSSDSLVVRCTADVVL
jgi:hypothetical protein